MRFNKFGIAKILNGFNEYLLSFYYTQALNPNTDSE